MGSGSGSRARPLGRAPASNRRATAGAPNFSAWQGAPRGVEEFRRGGDIGALRAAVGLFGQAVDVAAGDDPHLPLYLSNLGTAWQDLFERTGELDALTEAVAAGRAAVLATSDEYPDLGMYLSNLGLMLRAQCERTHEPALVQGDCRQPPRG